MADERRQLETSVAELVVEVRHLISDIKELHDKGRLRGARLTALESSHQRQRGALGVLALLFGTGAITAVVAYAKDLFHLGRS